MSDLHDRARAAYNRIGQSFPYSKPFAYAFVSDSSMFCVKIISDDILSRPDMKKMSMISKENNFNTHSKYHFKL